MSISDIMTIIGIPALFGTLVYMGRQLQILSNLTVTVEKMKVNIKVIADALTNSNIPFDCKKIQSYSPLRLTDEGFKFLQEVGFIDIFMKNEKVFFDHIDEDKPQIDYDVEKSAIRSVFFLFDEPFFNTLKDYLYNNPETNRKELINMAGIYVRDQYIKKKM